jgi:hypothetical protein
MIGDEVKKIRQKCEEEINDNVYIALSLGLMAHRHVLLSCDDRGTALYRVGYIMNTIWGLKSTALEVHGGMTRDNLLEFFVGGSIGGKLGLAYVIEGIDQLPNVLQNVVLEIMRTKRLTYKEQTIQCGELFTIIGITKEKDTLLPLLNQEFWFRQLYEPLTTVTNKQYPTSETLNASKVTYFISFKSRFSQVTIVPEIKRYIYDIVIHVRCHRCVSTGFPTRSITDLELLSQCLCVLFDREYVIPTVVKLACRKLIPFKIRMVAPDLEPTLQYGSDADLVKELLRRMTPKLVLEDVLRKVSPPL